MSYKGSSSVDPQWNIISTTSAHCLRIFKVSFWVGVEFYVETTSSSGLKRRERTYQTCAFAVQSSWIVVEWGLCDVSEQIWYYCIYDINAVLNNCSISVSEIAMGWCQNDVNSNSAKHNGTVAVYDSYYTDTVSRAMQNGDLFIPCIWVVNTQRFGGLMGIFGAKTIHLTRPGTTASISDTEPH